MTVQVSCPIRRRATTPPLWSPMLSCLVPRFGSEDTKMPSQSPPTFSLQQCKSSDLSCASKVFLAIRFRLQLPQCAKKSFHRTKNLFICDPPPLTFCLRGEGGLPLISSSSSSSLTHWRFMGIKEEEDSPLDSSRVPYRASLCFVDSFAWQSLWHLSLLQ